VLLSPSCTPSKMDAGQDVTSSSEEEKITKKKKKKNKKKRSKKKKILFVCVFLCQFHSPTKDWYLAQWLADPQQLYFL